MELIEIKQEKSTINIEKNILRNKMKYFLKNIKKIGGLLKNIIH
jgi:hypothetical protein